MKSIPSTLVYAEIASNQARPHVTHLANITIEEGARAIVMAAALVSTKSLDTTLQMAAALKEGDGGHGSRLAWLDMGWAKLAIRSSVRETIRLEISSVVGRDMHGSQAGMTSILPWALVLPPLWQPRTLGAGPDLEVAPGPGGNAVTEALPTDLELVLPMLR